MSFLIEKILQGLTDPALVAVVIAFSLTIAVLWRLFNKQHEFIKERMEILRQDNEDLREHIALFKNENSQLRGLTDRMRTIITELTSQSSETKKNVEDFKRISSEAQGLLEERMPAIGEGFSAMVGMTEQSHYILTEGFKRLEEAIREKDDYRNEFMEFVDSWAKLQGVKQDELRKLANRFLDKRR